MFPNAYTDVKTHTISKKKTAIYHHSLTTHIHKREHTTLPQMHSQSETSHNSSLTHSLHQSFRSSKNCQREIRKRSEKESEKEKERGRGRERRRERERESVVCVVCVCTRRHKREAEEIL